MSRSYLIWVEIESCAYQSSKSYGIKNTGSQVFKVGSSASNSHKFVSTATTRREDGDKIIFTFSVDGMILKRMIFKNNKGRAGELIETINLLLENPDNMLGKKVEYFDSEPEDTGWVIQQLGMLGDFTIISDHHRIVSGISRTDFKVLEPEK